MAPLAYAQQSRPEAHQCGAKANILYRTEGELTGYMRERCRLGVYYPVGALRVAGESW